ncbi:cryptochrome/photolyase family protein [Legionella sp. CNM-4043-24]|uniref:cryptochrome/photolyase family protein n=1 Tax=Legionella sp. CNM-4043-24 TaxID=3421646 RepID=UPI00403B1DEC
MSSALYWFRQDLRCQDNPALQAACQAHSSLLPLYIDCLPGGGAQRWWLHHSLSALRANLHEHGLNLCLRRGDPLSILLQLIDEHSIDTVYWNRCYEPQAIERDTAIKTALTARGVTVKSFNGALLNEPWTVSNQSGQYYKVFTPYWRQCLLQMPQPVSCSIEQWPAPLSAQSDSLEDWRLLPQNPNWAAGFQTYWQPGEQGALDRLSRFIKNQLGQYGSERDIPIRDATSRLSPHLHFGEISPWRLWQATQEARQLPGCNLHSTDRFLAELGWREFSHYLLYHFPGLPDTNFKSEFNAFPWQQDDEALKRWQRGLTGYPIVDAGMRELWHSGYMHNRVRMIVASFLIKDLLIDWRVGAAWFWDTLLDADLANNSASWQWVAGCGADAAPYFRIFNPVLQGEKFDPAGEYVKKWVPELHSVNSKWIHKPWEAPFGQLAITLGRDYPHRLVDHNKARNFALASYKALERDS